MWKEVWLFQQFEDTWKNSYWWNTIQLLKVWKQVQPIIAFEDTWETSYWWKTIQLLKVWKKVQSNTAFEDTWKNSYCSNYVNSKIAVLGRDMKEFILKINHPAAQSVTRILVSHVVWKNMKCSWCSVNHSIWRHMKEFKLMKNHSAAKNVKKSLAV